METKVTILGEAEAVKPELKKIEFVRYLSGDIVKTDPCKPSQWKNIELIKRGSGNLDTMFAFDDSREDGLIYLGHFNDGVV